MMDLLKLVEENRYEELFDSKLFWDPGDYSHALKVFVEDEDEDEGGSVQTFTLENVAAYKGIRVFICNQLPSRTVQAKIARQIGQKSTHYFLIFHDGGAHQTWRWPAQVLRGEKASIKLTSHEHTRGLQNPKLLKRLEAITLTPGETLSATQMYDKIQTAFDTETADETKKASKLMVDLFEALKEANMSEEHISETLARVLFVMFGDDTEMWGAGSGNLFERYVREHTAEDGSDIAVKLNELFLHLDTKPVRDGALAAEGKSEFKGFRYVNGGIFSDMKPLPAGVGVKFREAILRASRTDWADISPAIFGSMFQSARDAKTRRAMGEHYTSEKDILKTLNPLFLDELREVFHNARDKSDESKRLRDLRQRISRIKFMDPACGCGNFIIVAYRELRALETAIVARLVEIGTIKEYKAGFVLNLETQQNDKERVISYEPMVVIDNFYGIEIDPWPAAIARTAMFLIERQSDLLMNEKFGYTPTRLPIRQESHIVTADALRADWHEILPVEETDEVYVAGNPPFIGQKEKSKEQTAAMKEVWGKEYDGYLDYVTAWFKKTIDYFKALEVLGKEFAFVSTNSIVQGQPVASLFEPIFNDGWKFKFAYQSFPWSSEAAVHCVITGYTLKSLKQRLFKYSVETKETTEINNVKNINAYLVDGEDIFVRKRSDSKKLSKDLPPIKAGSKSVDWGEYTFKAKEEMAGILKDDIAKKYIRKYIGGDELINGVDRWCLWLEAASSSDIEESAELNRRVTSVRKMRLESTRIATLKAANTPELFGENRQPKTDYLGIPQTFSENRIYATASLLPKEVIASIKLFTVDDSDGFAFSIISSSIFINWQKAIGGRMKSDISFSNTIVWNNIPLPPVSTDLREKIIAAGRGVLEARKRICEDAGDAVSLASMYKPDSMPKELLAAHKALDVLVDQAFGAKEPLTSNEERLKLLFKQYAKMIAAEEKTKSFTSTKKRKSPAPKKI